MSFLAGLSRPFFFFCNAVFKIEILNQIFSPLNALESHRLQSFMRTFRPKRRVAVTFEAHKTAAIHRRYKSGRHFIQASEYVCLPRARSCSYLISFSRRLTGDSHTARASLPIRDGVSGRGSPFVGCELRVHCRGESKSLTIESRPRRLIEALLYRLVTDYWNSLTCYWTDIRVIRPRKKRTVVAYFFGSRSQPP